jgi:hypothetical protein
MKAGMSRRNFSEGGFCLDKTLLRLTMPAMPRLTLKPTHKAALCEAKGSTASSNPLARCNY